jgi:hypothetical protein
VSRLNAAISVIQSLFLAAARGCYLTTNISLSYSSMDGAALTVDALRGPLAERQAVVDVQAEAMRMDVEFLAPKTLKVSPTQSSTGCRCRWVRRRCRV